MNGLYEFLHLNPAVDFHQSDHVNNGDIIAQHNKKDIVSRRFREKKRIVRDDVEGMRRIDYIRNMTNVAFVGEFGFDTVVGAGGHYLDAAENMAERAFGVS